MGTPKGRKHTAAANGARQHQSEFRRTHRISGRGFPISSLTSAEFLTHSTNPLSSFVRTHTGARARNRARNRNRPSPIHQSATYYSVAVLALAVVASIASPSARAEIAIAESTDKLEIRIADKPFATYVWSDPNIVRPYFCNVHAPNGAQVTRSYPTDPVINKGNDDHATMHPGIWLAFGDVNGLDVWRNKARVWHAHFVEKPFSDDDHATFTVLNVYDPLTGSSDASFYETCRYDVYALDIGWFIIAQSAFQSRKGEIRFGDQEEMGLGVRMQTPLTVKFGNGTILNSQKGRNEYGTWGFPAKWCSAYGKVDDAFVGATIMPGPDNFRTSWYHSRDYGLVVANPFGKKAMTAANKDEVPPDVTIVPRSNVFRLMFGVFVFSTTLEPDNTSAFEWFTELLSQCEPPKPPVELLQDDQRIGPLEIEVRVNPSTADPEPAR
ncbi:MAG: PmoA family protein [Candidatus Hydrogenedentes bacterium]|nr:PmoA family protein [Candidatus Hydrogenedentota bacterium]